MGTYEEVLAHEKKLGISTGSEQDVHIEERHDRVLLRIYEAPDGFRGTYDEVEEHEAKTVMAKGLEHVVEEIYKVLQASICCDLLSALFLYSQPPQTVVDSCFGTTSLDC